MLRRWSLVGGGSSGALVLCDGHRFLKRVPANAEHRAPLLKDLQTEAWMLRHLSARNFPVPELVSSGADYLLTRKLRGSSLRQDFRRQHTPSIVKTLAGWFRRLHHLPCPREAPLQDMAADLARARQRLEHRQIPAQQPGSSAWETWKELSQNVPAVPVTCLTHGDPWPCNILFHTDVGEGVVDWARSGRGPAQRDLAILERALGHHYGPEAGRQFWEEYGPRPAHLEWFRQLSLLL